MNKEKLDELAINCVTNYFLSAATSMINNNFDFNAKEIIKPYIVIVYAHGEENAVNYFYKKFNEIFSKYVIFIRNKTVTVRAKDKSYEHTYIEENNG